MNFKQAINENIQLKSIYEHLVIKTSMGRDYLFGLEFSTSRDFLEKQYELTEKCQKFLEHTTPNDKMLLECILYDVHNIIGSINLIKRNENLDDIGLFEIKAFCLSCNQLNKSLEKLDCEDFVLDTFEDIIDILDPEHTKSRQFYIYNAYNPKIEGLRKEFEQLKKQDSPLTAQIYNEILEIENGVRGELCQKIRPQCQRLEKAVEQVALLDISIAKAELNIEMSLIRPQINDSFIEYKKIFNPIIKESLNKKGKSFQAIDISCDNRTILITGANMAGKTVILKTLAINQLLAQFGFFVAAETANICLVEGVLQSIGDNQDENQGLSSFASEILTLNNIIKQVKTKKRYLVLVDELARTTNPIEGVKLLNGFISTINLGSSICVITTHYSNITSECLHFRVRGFINNNLQPPISLTNLSDNIDYSIVEDNTNTTPTEALNLCRLLGIDSDWMDRCK